MADLSVELAGLELANPVLLASGILDSTPGILERMADSGAGALITKSISLEPRPGYAGPTVAEVAPGTYVSSARATRCPTLGCDWKRGRRKRYSATRATGCSLPLLLNSIREQTC